MRFVCLLLGILTGLGQAASIEYVVLFPEPHKNYFVVEASYPADVEVLTLPVWTPGSYKVRDYSKHLDDLEATDSEGRPIDLEKVTKNRWRVGTRQAFRLRYRVYAHTLTVRHNWVDQDFALINGAATYLTPHNQSHSYSVTFRPPSHWKSLYTSLEEQSGHYQAASYDRLVDCPAVLGNPSVASFSLQNRNHILVNLGDEGRWPASESIEEVESIVTTGQRFWGDLPYRRYLFLNLLTETRGGIEHADSTVLMASRWQRTQRKDYLNWLSLVAHEYFHVWNVKRLRPFDLTNLDYERENYTKSLWIAEGITAYYDDLLVKRAGLSTESEYLKALSQSFKDVQTTPGRRRRSLSEASFDAWIKLYQPDEHLKNSSVSYYRKGALVALLTDVAIRRASQGKRSLDDVMRKAYARFPDGFEENQFRKLVSETAEVDLSDFLAQAVDSTEELDFSPFLTHFGLRFEETENESSWLGVDCDAELRVERVIEGGPGHQAGLNPGDELLGLDDFRVDPTTLKDRLKAFKPGQTITVLVARRGVLERLTLTLQGPPSDWNLEVDPEASQVQNRRRQSWLSQPAAAGFTPELPNTQAGLIH